MKKRDYILTGLFLLTICLFSFAITRNIENTKIERPNTSVEPAGFGAIEKVIAKEPRQEKINENGKIKWEGENNVEFTPKKTIKDIDGNDIEVWNTDHIQSYGQETIDEQVELFTKALDNANAFDCEAYKAGLVAGVQAELDKLADIQTVIDFK